MTDRSSPFYRAARHRPAQGQPTGRRLLRLWAVLALVATGCGGGDHPPPAGGADGARLDHSGLLDYDSAEEGDAVAGGSCTPGSTQQCRVYLPAHDGIQPCFVGEQRCIDSRWSECSDAVLVDANQDDAAIEPADP